MPPSAEPDVQRCADDDDYEFAADDRFHDAHSSSLRARSQSVSWGSFQATFMKGSPKASFKGSLGV